MCVDGGERYCCRSRAAHLKRRSAEEGRICDESAWKLQWNWAMAALAGKITGEQNAA